MQLDNIAIFAKYVISKGLDLAGIHFGKFEIPQELYIYIANDFSSNRISAWEFWKLVDIVLPSIAFGILPYMTIFFAVVSIFTAVYARSYLEDDDNQIKAVRGAQITSTKQLVRQLRKAQGESQSGLFAEPILIPHEYETRHILIAGSTGTGKSVILCQFIKSVYQQKMLIYDRKGELYAKFGNKKDILWNPYDSRFCGWSIFNEFELYQGLTQIPEELVNLANSLFSTSASNKNKTFYDGAASIFKSGCCYLKINNMTTNQELSDFFNSGASYIKSAIGTLPKGLQEGMAFLIGEGDVVASFMSCLVERTKSFQSLVGQDGDLSIREWIKNPQKGRLFLSTAGENDTIYQPILTMLIDIIGGEIRAMSEKPQRRIYLFLDELSSLPPLKTLKMLLREGRSKGACCILGTQTMAAIEGKYGKADSADIFGLCNSLFIFRTNEPGQAEYFAKALGNVERIKLRQSSGKTHKGLLGESTSSDNEAEQNITENLFLAGELQSLPVGQAVVKIAHFPVAKVQFVNNQFKEMNQGFVKREMKLATEDELESFRAVRASGGEAKEMKEEDRTINTFNI